MSGESENEEPWVCPGYSEEHEDELIGNREGFRLLRKKIDEVLESGHAPVQEARIEWIALKLAAVDPRKKKEKRFGRDFMALVVVAAVSAVVLFVFVTGAWTIYSWWK